MAKKEGKELTPMMKQFFDFKAKYPEALLLFRCGWLAFPIMLWILICQN